MENLELGDPVVAKEGSAVKQPRRKAANAPQGLGDHQRSPEEEDERSVVYIDTESVLERHDESTR